ncbi:PREDICTED: spindle and centriole-associated protein 1 [Hipposideros armiger]|uniref:Spindle and centriole-associated protein 1 n=1 Tax=Hipposideros armiger TaxID=186990 RepID=A0A8B7S370_HIPAR|nr:PREDICTED: spindle and centriole-associated protein 1 [Hipposideros armiger]
MSFVRVNRYSPRGGGRKALKIKKKKSSVKQEWDNTVNDLTVHRATPEDLVYIEPTCVVTLIFVLRKALNEVEDGEEEETINSLSEASENELDNSLNSQSHTNTDRYVHMSSLRRTVQTRPAPRIPPTVEIIEKEQNWEKKTLPTGTHIQNSSEENHLFTQRWRVSHMGEDSENKTQAPFVSLSQPLCNPHSNTQPARNPALSDEPSVLGDGQQLRANEVLMQRKDIMARIAELTLQNSAIKAHLNNIIGPWGEQGDGLRELNQQETSHTGDMTATFPASQPLTPSSMEERIAELNRQSMEARGKLLQLIEQQKLVGLNPSSPPVSPIQSPLRAWTGWSQIHDLKVFKLLPIPVNNDRLLSHSLLFFTNRSSGATSNSCSPLNATSGSGQFTPVNPRAKIEKQNEEGWFALSSHVS